MTRASISVTKQLPLLKRADHHMHHINFIKLYCTIVRNYTQFICLQIMFFVALKRYTIERICFFDFCNNLNYEQSTRLFHQKQMPDLRFGAHLGFLGGGEEQDFLTFTVEIEIIREKDCSSNIDQTRHTFEISAHYTQPHYIYSMHSLQ